MGVYSLCTKYQGDLQEVLDFLEIRQERAVRVSAKKQKQAPKTDHDGKDVPRTETEKGVNYAQARDTVEEIEMWQQAKETTVETSSWLVLAVGTLWSYFAGMLHISSGKKMEADL